MNKAFTAVCAGWLVMATPTVAQTTDAVVVELFTSQGCSSCPPADAVMEKLSADPRLITLSLHVDYWDYLGWKDKFANPQFTKRQKAYAHFAREKMVYTPQIIIQGQHRMIGSKTEEVGEAIEHALAQPRPTQVMLTRDGEALSIHAAPVGTRFGTIQVQLVRFSPVENVAIERGENSGKTIAYHNVVTSWQTVGSWNGTAPLNLKTTAQGAAPLAVILQGDGPSTIVAAATLR